MRAALVWSLAVVPTCASESTFVKNVHGEELQPCSTSGMAVTGVNRTGFCEGQVDTLAETICVNLATLASGENDFCKETDDIDSFCEDNDNENLYCPDPTDDTLTTECEIQAWCVSPAAFAVYIEEMGSCFAISDIVCKSINIAALATLEFDKDDYADALDCIIDRCGLYLSYRASMSALSTMGVRNSTVNMAGFAAVLVGMLMGVAWFIQRTVDDSDLEESLVSGKSKSESTLSTSGATECTSKAPEDKPPSDSTLPAESNAEDDSLSSPQVV